MTLAMFCIALAAFLPIVCAGIAKADAFRSGPDVFDNQAPRDWLARQTGYRARAYAAQANSWEALAVFAPAVLAAHWMHAPQVGIDALALAFIAARIVYIALYLANRDRLRSMVWLIGYAVSIGLFFVSFGRAP